MGGEGAGGGRGDPAAAPAGPCTGFPTASASSAPAQQAGRAQSAADPVPALRPRSASSSLGLSQRLHLALALALSPRPKDPLQPLPAAFDFFLEPLPFPATKRLKKKVEAETHHGEVTRGLCPLAARPPRRSRSVALGGWGGRVPRRLPAFCPESSSQSGEKLQ